MREIIRVLVKSFLLNVVVRKWNFIHLISREARPSILRYCGAKIGHKVYISRGVYFDNNVEYLIMGDDILISPNVTFLFHKRNLSDFVKGKKYNQCPMKKEFITVCNNSFIGIGATIMPGVTIGEGGGVASGAVVTKDVPPWSIVAGNPAKVIKQIID